MLFASHKKPLDKAAGSRIIKTEGRTATNGETLLVIRFHEENRHRAGWRFSLLSLNEITYPLICSVRYKKYMASPPFGGCGLAAAAYSVYPSAVPIGTGIILQQMFAPVNAKEPRATNPRQQTKIPLDKANGEPV